MKDNEKERKGRITVQRLFHNLNYLMLILEGYQLTNSNLTNELVKELSKVISKYGKVDYQSIETNIITNEANGAIAICIPIKAINKESDFKENC